MNSVKYFTTLRELADKLAMGATPYRTFTRLAELLSARNAILDQTPEYARLRDELAV